MHSFIEWARSSLAPLSSLTPGPPWDDLAPFGRMIGDATVVALSEGVHCAAEPLEFRNRLFQYLVEQQGFTAIAIESGLVEGRIVHDYVRGGTGDLDTVLAQGISWTFDSAPQNRALVQWLRAHNADPKCERKINFYGFDVPGSPGNAEARRGVDTALTEALKYLTAIDPQAGATFHARFQPLMRRLRFGFRRFEDGGGYEQLNHAERDALTAGIEDLITLLERREGPYTAAGSLQDYAWGYRAALGARQVDAWLRHVPLGWQPLSETPQAPSEHTRFFSRATDSRDRAQADNLDWVLKQEGPSGKILVFAARYHLSATPLEANWGPNGEGEKQYVAGSYLRRRLGDRLITIGNLIGGGAAGCGNYQQTFERAPSQSFDGLAGEVGTPRYLLDLRSAPAPIASWLDQEHSLVVASQTLKLPLRRAFDVIFYLDTVSPSSVSA